MKVYLAGPIANSSDSEVHDWRDMMTEMLAKFGIKSRDPAKLRDFRGVPYPGDIAVVEPDKADIVECDVLLAYTPKPSVGTSMEIIYAWEQSKFVVVVHPDPDHASPWIHYHAHEVTQRFSDALAAIVKFRRDPTGWTEHDKVKWQAVFDARPVPK